MKVFIVIGHVVSVAPLQHCWRKPTNSSERYKILAQRLKPPRAVNRVGTQDGIGSDRLEHRIRSEHETVCGSHKTNRARRVPGRVNYDQALVIEQNFVSVFQPLDSIKWIRKASELLVCRFHLIYGLARNTGRR